jgi:hypothetical protein
MHPDPPAPEATQPDTQQTLVPQDEIDGLQTSPPDHDDIEPSVKSEPVEDEDGNEVIIAQQNMGTQGSVGGGEFPDPNTPPSDGAPGRSS